MAFNFCVGCPGSAGRLAGVVAALEGVQTALPRRAAPSSHEAYGPWEALGSQACPALVPREGCILGQPQPGRVLLFESESAPGVVEKQRCIQADGECAENWLQASVHSQPYSTSDVAAHGAGRGRGVRSEGSQGRGCLRSLRAFIARRRKLLGKNEGSSHTSQEAYGGQSAACQRIHQAEDVPLRGREGPAESYPAGGLHVLMGREESFLIDSASSRDGALSVLPYRCSLPLRGRRHSARGSSPGRRVLRATPRGGGAIRRSKGLALRFRSGSQ